MSNTPYDDVFRTLVNDCSELLLPLLNELFGEHYVGNESILFRPNEHFLNQQDGMERERITDTCFEVIGSMTKKYHLECQSTEDHTMLIRMFEYDTQIALDDGELSGGLLVVTFPCSAIVQLRGRKKDNDGMQIVIRTQDNELTYTIPVFYLQEYSLNDLFEKKLLFLLPFYIFLHESRFAEYDSDEQKREEFIQEFSMIRAKLETLSREHKVSEYIQCTLIDMSKKVMESITRNYAKVQEGVMAVMGGKVLEYEAKTILREGIEQGYSQGYSQGISQGCLETYLTLVKDGILTIEEAACRLGKSVEKLQEYLI